MSRAFAYIFVATCVLNWGNAVAGPGSGNAALEVGIQQAGRTSPPASQPTLPEELRSQIAVVMGRLASVESTIEKSSERADNVALRSSLFSLATVLVGALLAGGASWGTQALLMSHQRKSSRADAEAKVANSYVEWQLKQLSELYAPLRALLGQSNVLYRQMNRALVAADATRFRLVPGSDFDDQTFEIRLGDQWVRFRTVKHLGEVYNKQYGVEPYFNDVVDVGSRIVSVIEEKAGYARQEDDRLVIVMGEYLAHYLVLKRLLARAKAGETLHENAADEHATFPTDIQKLVNDGFREINKQVIEWRSFKKLAS